MNHEGTKDQCVEKSRDPRAEQRATQVIGAAITVHRHLDPGYLESVYEQALSLELDNLSIPYVRPSPFGVTYRDHPVGEGRLDFLIDQCLIVELKAVEALAPIHLARVLSYLKATRLGLGLLINFNVPTLKQGIKRVVL